MTNDELREMRKVLEGKDSKHILDTAYVYLSLKEKHEEASLVSMLETLITEKRNAEYRAKYVN